MYIVTFLVNIYIFIIFFTVVEAIGWYLGYNAFGDDIVLLRAFIMFFSFISGWLFHKKKKIDLLVLFPIFIVSCMYGFLPITFLISYICGFFYEYINT